MDNYKTLLRDFPGGPVVKNPPCNAGDMGSIPSQGTEIPHTTEQLSPRFWVVTCRVEEGCVPLGPGG